LSMLATFWEKFESMRIASWEKLVRSWKFVEFMLSADYQKFGAQGLVSSRLEEDGRKIRTVVSTSGVLKGEFDVCIQRMFLFVLCATAAHALKNTKHRTLMLPP
jgi:hypothetical protein